MKQRPATSAMQDPQRRGQDREPARAPGRSTTGPGSRALPWSRPKAPGAPGSRAPRPGCRRGPGAAGDAVPLGLGLGRGLRMQVREVPPAGRPGPASPRSGPRSPAARSSPGSSPGRTRSPSSRTKGRRKRFRASRHLRTATRHLSLQTPRPPNPAARRRPRLLEGHTGARWTNRA